MTVHPITPQAAPPEPRLYKVPEVMAMLSMSRSLVYEQIRAGRLRAVKQGRARLISSTAVADYIGLLEREAAQAVQVA